MKTAFAVLYLWGAFWTGSIFYKEYTPEEGRTKAVMGSLVLGAWWPLTLPIFWLYHEGPFRPTSGGQS